MKGLTLDSGALIALERGERVVALLLDDARKQGERLTVPATVLAQVLRSPARQTRLMKLCRQASTDVVSLDRRDASAVGQLLAVTRTTDIADAHVVVCARRAQQDVVTSDPDDIARLDPAIKLVRV